MSDRSVCVAYWRRSSSGWWSLHFGSYARWRDARRVYRCDDCGAEIPKGARYVASRITPWSESWDSFWGRRSCGACHPEWNPPA